MRSGGSSKQPDLSQSVRRLAEAGCDTPRLDAELLVRAGASLDRRVAREPVAYILGSKGFRHIDLRVDARVLVPRPETELLVEVALELPAGARVVDVGTGSGAIALALKQERHDLEVMATDVSAEALAVARANAARLDLDVEFRQGDLLAGIAACDAVLSNPPYVRDAERATLAPEIVRHEPPAALFAGEDGLDVIRRLIPAAAGVAPWLALEVGAGQARTVGQLMSDAGFAEVSVRRDLAGIERVVVGSR